MGEYLAAAYIVALVLIAYRWQDQALVYILVVIFAPVTDWSGFLFCSAMALFFGAYAKWLRAASK